MRFPTVSDFAGIFAAAALATPATAATLTTLHTFSGNDGAYPSWSGFVAGPNGSFFGETVQGGAANAGTVFQMVPPSTASTHWTLTTIHSFGSRTDGALPFGLIGDAAGNLFGVTENGGEGNCPFGCGEVFELSPPAPHQTAWTKTTLYLFQNNGSDGALPLHGLVQDAAGNLFGATSSGPGCEDPNGCGTVFEVSPPSRGQNRWTGKTLYNFTKEPKGVLPGGVPLLDAAGNLYGLTTEGGSLRNPRCTTDVYGCGTIYRLSPPAQGGATWTHTTLWKLDGSNGLFPFTALSMDAAGSLYGLAGGGGKDCADDRAYDFGCGTLFELSPPGGGGGWTASVLWKFTGRKDGRLPWAAGLTPYGKNFITTTSGDEVNQFGSVDMFIPPTREHPAWAERTLFTFTNDANGENPESLLFRQDDMVYGMTGGSSSNASPAPYGTIFSIGP